jgi:hypothetical protein
MQNERDITNHLVAFLKSQGYPQDTIFYERRISDHKIIDLAVIDIIANRYIALFEVIRTKSEDKISIAKEQIKNYAKALKDDSIPLYIVTSIEQNPYFQIYSLAKLDGKDVLELVDQMPSFASLRSRSISKEKNHIKEENRKTLDWFKYMCWFLAAAIVVLLILDFRGNIKLSPERLGVIAIISALAILPYAKKLNILGLEFERLQKDASDKKI